MILDFNHLREFSTSSHRACIDITPMGSSIREYYQPPIEASDMFIDISKWGYGEAFARYFESHILGVTRFDQTFEVGGIPSFTMEGFLQQGKGVTLMGHERCHLCQAPQVEVNTGRKKVLFSAGDPDRPKFDPYGTPNKSSSEWKEVTVYTYSCGTTVEYDSDKFEDHGTVVTLGKSCLKLLP